MRGAVLAGGAASRFGGRPKGLEEVGGKRILDRVTQAIHDAVGALPLLISNSPEAPQWRPDLKVMHDAIRECGSLGGIYTALSAGEGPVLVVAWDMPFVTANLLRKLIERGDEYDVFVPESTTGESELEPLCAVYGQRCLAPIRERLVDEDFRVQGFLDAVRVGRLPADEMEQLGDPETLFFNVNTPDDLKQAEDMWRTQNRL
ncbi:MAG: molybdenum cofactor guanylyltransferase [Gemmatimonadota bacterium]|nr:MAG: molybdenum cofactor guanylyltransferase [Gemmatimonadota bacterium]